MAPISLYVPSKVKYPDYKYPIEFIYKASENYQKGFLENMDKIEKAQEKIYDIQALHPVDQAKLKEIKTKVDGIITKYSTADLSLPHIQHAIESEFNNMLKIPELQTIQKHNKQITEANERRKKLQEKNKYSPISDYNYRKQLSGYTTFSDDANFDAIIIENFDVKAKLSKVMKDNVPDITSEIQMYETGPNNTYKVYDPATGNTKYVTKGTRNEIDPVTGTSTGNEVSDAFQYVPLPEGMLYIEESKKRTLQEAATIINNHLDANDLNILDLNLKVMEEQNPELYNTMNETAKSLDMDILTYYAIYLPAKEYEFTQTKISGLTTLNKLKGNTKDNSTSTKKETKTKEQATKDNAQTATKNTDISPAVVTATYNAYETTSLFIDQSTGEMIEDVNQYKANVERFQESYERPEQFATTLFATLQAQGVPITMDKKAVNGTFNGILLKSAQFPDLFNPGKRERFVFIDENSTTDNRVEKIKKQFETYGSKTDYNKAVTILNDKAAKLTSDINANPENKATLAKQRDDILQLITDIESSNSKATEQEIKNRLTSVGLKEGDYNSTLNNKDIENIILNINRMGQSYNETLDFIDMFNDLKTNDFVQKLSETDKNIFNKIQETKGAKGIGKFNSVYYLLSENKENVSNVASIFKLVGESEYISNPDAYNYFKNNLVVFLLTATPAERNEILAPFGNSQENWTNYILSMFKQPVSIDSFLPAISHSKIDSYFTDSSFTVKNGLTPIESKVIDKALSSSADEILTLISTKMDNDYNGFSTKALVKDMVTNHLMKSYGVVSSLSGQDRSSFTKFIESKEPDKKTGEGGSTPLQIYEADLANSVRPISLGEKDAQLGQNSKGAATTSIQPTISVNPSLTLFDVRLADTAGATIQKEDYKYNQKLDIDLINTTLAAGSVDGYRQQIVGINYSGLTFKDGKWYGYGNLVIKDNMGKVANSTINVFFENKTQEGLLRTDMTTSVNTLMGTDSKYNIGNFLEYRINTTPNYNPAEGIYTYTDTELINGATVTIAKKRNTNGSLIGQGGDFIYQVQIKDNGNGRTINFAKKDSPDNLASFQHFNDPNEIAESLLPMIQKSLNNAFINIQVDTATFKKYQEIINNDFLKEGNIFRTFETGDSKTADAAFKSMNGKTSATGYFQIMFNTHKDRIIQEAAKMTNNNGDKKYANPELISRENFRDDNELQQKVYSSLLKDEIIPAVEYFKKYSNKFPYSRNLCDQQLIYLVHREGAGGAAKYLASNGTVYTTEHNTNLTEDLNKIGKKYCF